MEHRMTARVLRWSARAPFFAFALLWAAGGPPAALAAETFLFNGATSTYHHIYQVGIAGDNAVTFNIQAQSGGVNDPTFTGASGVVTVGLVDSTSGNPSDPLAVYVIPGAGAPVSGPSIPMTFNAGVLDFGVTLEAGTNSEQVTLFNGTAAGSYPGVANGGITCQGFSVPYYLDLANFEQSGGNPASLPATYSALPAPPNNPNTDQLIPNNPSSNEEENFAEIQVPQSSSVTGALCFAVTGVNGSYAAGGAGVPVSLWAGTNGISNTMHYEAILDYNGAVTNFNAPLSQFAAGTTVTVIDWSSTVNNDIQSSQYDPYTGAGVVSGTPVTVSNMQNGQIVMRVWCDVTSGSAVTLRYAANGDPNPDYSFVQVPYSPNNVQPLEGAILPPNLFLDGAVTTLQYAVTNLFPTGPVSLFGISIPPNSPASGTYWHVNSVTASPGVYSSGFSVASQPTGSLPGTILFNSANASGGATLAYNQSMTLSIGVNCSSETNTAWQFPITFAVASVSGSSVTISSVSPNAQVGTLGVPSKSTSLFGAPVSYNAGGGSVSLSWAPVVDQDPTGYVLSRSPGAGSGNFSATATLPDGTTYPNAILLTTAPTTFIDNTATNLTGYTYTLAAFNPVADGPATAFGPVTAFANPGPPTALTALTGGPTVQLNWTAPGPVAGSFPLAGYQVFRNGTAVATVTVPTVTYLDTGLAGGVSDTYTVSAFDNVGPAGPVSSAHNGGPSNIDYGYPLDWPPVLSPSLPMGESGPVTYLTLSWIAPTKNLNPISTYNVWRQTGAGPFTQVENGGSTLLYDDSNLAIGISYQYYVQAVDNQGVTSNNSVTVTGQEGPAQPQGFSGTGGAVAFTLTWNSVTTGDPAVSYAVFRSSSAGSTIIAEAGAGAAQTLVDSNNLTQGINYSYYVAGVDSHSVTGANSVTLALALLPAAPAGVTAFSANQVNGTVNWAASAVTNLTGYNLYRNTQPVTTGAGWVTVASNIPVTQAGNPVTTTTDLTSLTPGTVYYYFLQAVNPGGGSALALAGFETPPNSPVFTAPPAHSSNSAITLTWTASSGAVSYTVYENSAAPVSIGITNTTSFAVTSGLSPGVNYSFQLTAEDYGGGTLLGGASTMTAPITWGLAPQPVSITSLSVSLLAPPAYSAVTVNWTPVTEANALGVSLMYDTATTILAGAGESLPVTATSGSFNYFGPDYNYYFWALVYNAYGTSTTVSYGAATLTYPYPVTLNAITLAADGVSRILSWTPNPPMGVNISQFIVYREETAPIASGWSPAVTLLGNVSLPVTLTEPIAPAATYADMVVAVNATGSGPNSNPQTFSSLPAAPVSVTALSGLSTASSAVSLSWADSYAVSEGVTAYVVYRSTSNATTAAYTAAATVAYPGPFTYTDNSAAVTATGVYYYIITAEVNGEQTELVTANAVSVRSYEEPNSPGVPTAVPSNNNVQLNWTPAGSTTYPVAGYDIYRSTSASVTTAALLNTSPDPVTLYNDPTAVNLTTYYYWVSMVDTAGDSSTLSGPVSAEPSECTQRSRKREFGGRG